MSQLVAPAASEIVDNLSTPAPEHPTFPQHRPEVIHSIIRQLKHRGFFGAGRFCRQPPLEPIVEAIADIDAMIEEGVEVHNPAALVRWRVERRC